MGRFADRTAYTVFSSSPIEKTRKRLREIQDARDDTGKNICRALEISFEVIAEGLLDVPSAIPNAPEEILQSEG